MRRVLLGLLLCLLLFGCARPYASSGEYVYVVGQHGGLSVFNPETGEHVRDLAFPDGSQALLSADGHRLWLLSPQRGQEAWQMRSLLTGAWLQTASVPTAPQPTYRVFTPFVTLSADGRRVVALNRAPSPIGMEMRWLEVYDTKSQTWQEQRFGVDCLTWRVLVSPNGRHVAALCDGQVTVISLETGAAEAVPLPQDAAFHTYYPRVATAGAFSKDGMLYVARRDGYVNVIDPVRQEVLRSSLPELPRGWGIGVECLVISPDGKRLYVGVNDPLMPNGLTEIWVLSTEDLSVTAKFKSPAPFSHFALNAQGTRLFVLGAGRLFMLDAASGEPIRDWAVDEAAGYVLTPGNP